MIDNTPLIEVARDEFLRALDDASRPGRSEEDVAYATDLLTAMRIQPGQAFVTERAANTFAVLVTGPYKAEWSISRRTDEGHGKWWAHETPGGVTMFTGRRIVPMAELIEIDEREGVDREAFEAELDEDPDADGYGWERRALNGAFQ